MAHECKTIINSICVFRKEILDSLLTSQSPKNEERTLFLKEKEPTRHRICWNFNLRLITLKEHEKCLVIMYKTDISLLFYKKLVHDNFFIVVPMKLESKKSL